MAFWICGDEKKNRVSFECSSLRKLWHVFEGGLKVVWESGMYMFIRGMTYVLNEGTLVLEGVTLAQVVELVVQVLVDLAGGTVADEETTENTHAAHPEDLAIRGKVSQ